MRAASLPITPDSPEEWELELRAFVAANRTDVPADVRETVKDLWAQCVAREVWIKESAA